MLSKEDNYELSNFLNRLQGQEVRVEFTSRLNSGYRFSFKVKFEKSADNYIFTSNSGEVSVFVSPQEAESFSSDHSSVSLLFADELITIRFARTR